MTDHALPDLMILILIAGAGRPDERAFPFPTVRSPQSGGPDVFRSRDDLDKAAEGLLRRGYLRRAKTTVRDHIWRTVRGVGDVTLFVTPSGRRAINW
jgi:hypothetical protein